MSNVKVKLGSKGMIIALIIGVLLLGGGGGYLLWRVNQPKTVAPTESEAGRTECTCGGNTCYSCPADGCQWYSGGYQCKEGYMGCGGYSYMHCCKIKSCTKYYDVIFNVASSGGGTINNGGGEVLEGSTVSSKAEPNTGYQFNGWTGSGGGTVSDLNNPILTISNVNSDGTYTANFKEKPPETVTVKYTVSPEGKGKVVNTNGVDITNKTITVNKGSTAKATAKAIAGSGYRFQKWDDGKTNPTRTDTINQNVTFKAIFEPIPKVTLTYIAAKVEGKEAGTLTSPPGEGTEKSIITQTIDKGTDAKAVAASAKTGYQFNGWDDGKTNATRTDTNVQASKTYTANFKKAPPNKVTLTYTTDGHGKVNGEESVIQTIDKGANGKEVTATANSGYEFDKWSDNKKDNPRTDKNVQENATYTAKFNRLDLVNCTDFGLSCGENNTILVSWKSVPGAIKYGVRINKEPKDDWLNENGGDEYRSFDSSVLSTTIENVESGKIYGISVVAYDGPDEQADFHPSCGLTGLADVLEPPLYQEIACEGTTPIVVPGDTVPDTAIFDDTKDTILLGFGILVVGLGWTWIATLPKKAYKLVSDTSDSFSKHVSNVKIKQEKNVRDSRRNRLERRIK